MNNKKGLSREELLSAMALMDGEIHGDLKHVAQSIVQPGPRQEAARATYVLGEFVRDWAAEKSANFDISDAVMAKVAAEQEPRVVAAPVNAAVIPFPQGRVVAGDRNGAIQAPQRSSSGARVFAIGSAVASVFAAAAAAMVFLSHQTDLKLDAPGLGQASMAKDLPTIDVQIQQVESSNTISVFQVPAAINANGTSVVIWIDDAVGVTP